MLKSAQALKIGTQGLKQYQCRYFHANHDRIDKMLEYVDEVLEWRVSLPHQPYTSSADFLSSIPTNSPAGSASPKNYVLSVILLMP